ncbi:hypothetical protein SAMN05444157_2520 [Frankineae bacterium MT45]|nr:hypothetical protein SAMN05444157_2520 [Frankineae bacterium MT45]
MDVSVGGESAIGPTVPAPSCDRRPRPAELPEVRLRRPAFDQALAQVGVTSYQSMAGTFGIDVDEIMAAMQGRPVTPSFVATVTMALPQLRFNELFQLNLGRPVGRVAESRSLERR